MIEEIILEKKTFKERVREKNRQLLDFRRFIRGESGGYFIVPFLGTDISIYFIKEWLESKFTQEMSWENYGSYWVVDHLVPLRLFNLYDENELKICWNYRNLMPLLKEDNLKKEGNSFFAFELLYELKNKDYLYRVLFDRILPEVQWMCKYIDKYIENK